MKANENKLKIQTSNVGTSLFNIGDEIGIETNVKRLIDVVKIKKIIKHPTIKEQFIYYLSNGKTIIDF